jgi:hypothetical protein
MPDPSPVVSTMEEPSGDSKISKINSPDPENPVRRKRQDLQIICVVLPVPVAGFMIGKKQQLFTPEWRRGVSERDEEDMQGRL